MNLKRARTLFSYFYEGTDGERETGKSVLSALFDDDDDEFCTV